MEYMTPNFTKDMVKTHKILIPNMAVTQFRLLQAALECEGYNVEVLGNCGSEVAQLGLKYVHNDTCYPALLVIGLVLGGSLHPQSFGAVPVLLFLAFISGAGYVIWALLMKNNPVSRIAVFGLIIPIMNVLLSAILNGEPLFEWQYLAALVLVCGGIYLVNRPNGKLESRS